MNIFLRWILNAATLIAIAQYVPGIHVSGWYAAFIAAFVLGIINIILKPILVILTLPVNILTLGLFTLIINAILFKFAGTIVKGFDVIGFQAAFFGALIMSIINIVVHSIFKRDSQV